MNYPSKFKVENQAKFSQDDPRYTCQWARKILETCREKVEARKIDYVFNKCGRVRCSIECNILYMNKMSGCRARLLSMYVDDPAYRGHLAMLKDATAAQHKDTSSEFLRIMRRWSRKHGYAFEVHAVQEITDPLNCHWDTVYYSDAPPAMLHEQVLKSWRQAGGSRVSLTGMSRDEIIAVCKYQGKDTEKERSRKKGERLIPTEGMQCVWYSKPRMGSKGFWNGRNIDDLWLEIREELYGPSNKQNALSEPNDDRDDDDLDPLVARYREVIEERRAAVRSEGFGSESAFCLLDDQKQQQLLAEVDSQLDRLEPNLRRDGEKAIRRLPDDPREPIETRRVAERHGWDEEYAVRVLDSLRTRGVNRVIVPGDPGTELPGTLAKYGSAENVRVGVTPDSYLWFVDRPWRVR